MDQNILDEMRDALAKNLTKGVTDEAVEPFKKNMRDLADEFFNSLEYRVQEDLASNLSAYVKDMAARVINALLDGNEREMRRYIGCEKGYWNGRSDGDAGWGRKKEIWEWHSVIHGTLFEQGSVALRKALVAAHRDLITDERVKDLEDQVASLVEQVNRANSAQERAEDRVRGYTR